MELVISAQLRCYDSQTLNVPSTGCQHSCHGLNEVFVLDALHGEANALTAALSFASILSLHDLVAAAQPDHPLEILGTSTCDITSPRRLVSKVAHQT